jgi:hypothetical protein
VQVSASCGLVVGPDDRPAGRQTSVELDKYRSWLSSTAAFGCSLGTAKTSTNDRRITSFLLSFDGDEIGFVSSARARICVYVWKGTVIE